MQSSNVMGGGKKVAQHLRGLKRFAQQLKRHLYVLNLAYHHERTPWYAKAFTLFIVAYALSPIDLIPDVIPVLGYVDEIILLPLGIFGAYKMIPRDVLQECRVLASTQPKKPFRKNWLAAAVIVMIWVLLVSWILLKWVF